MTGVWISFTIRSKAVSYQVYKQNLENTESGYMLDKIMIMMMVHLMNVTIFFGNMYSAGEVLLTMTDGDNG